MATRREFLAGVAASAAAGKAAVGVSAKNVVTLRTHEWYGDKLEEFDFPRGWNIKMHHSRGYQAPVLTPADIKKAILNPVGTKSLREIAEGKAKATIAVDDMCRPTPSAEIVPHVVAELNAAGIKDRNILFVMAHGCHMLMTPASAALKMGAEAVRKHPWVNHNAWENLVKLGKTRAGNQIEVDCNFYNADVKITLSGLKRHGAPGYGGGPKLCLPGLSGVNTIRYMHNVVKQSPRPRVNSEGIPIWRIYENEQRQDMIDVARAIGVDFSVQQCYNEDRKLIKVVAGDIVRAHHEACRFIIPNKSTDYAKNADTLIVNCYPRGEQLHELFSWASAGLKDGGSLVLINQYPPGETVWHFNDQLTFFQRGGGSYFKARDARKPRSRVGQVILYSQYLQERELSDPSMPPETLGCLTWADVIALLKKKHTGTSVEVAVYPAAGTQHEVATHDIPPDA